MLKGLLKDIVQGVRKRHQAPTPLTPLQELDLWRQEFSGASGERRQALSELLDAWIDRHPTLKQGWTLRADWSLTQKDLVAAEADYREALRLDPLSPSAQEGLGLTLLYAKRLDEAYLHLEHAHRSQPMNSEVLTHWGLVSLEQGNLAEAESKFNKAVERGPRNPHAWHNLGLVFLQAGQPLVGVQHMLKAVELKPDFGLAFSNLALAYRDAEDLPRAVEAAQKAASLKSGNARVWVVLADVQTDLGDLEGASRALDRALAIDPNDVGAWIARAKWDAARADTEQARQAFNTALQVDPGNPEAAGGLGQLELACGRFGAGWDLYESRKLTVARPVRSFGFPVWTGEPLAGKVLLVHAEQGLGDNIMFASCLPDLLAEAAHVVVETPPALAGLFARSFAGASVIGRDPQELDRTWLQSLPAIDFETSIGSIPRWRRRNVEDFPVHQGYLQADLRRVAVWRDRLRDKSDGPWLGLAWRGGLARSAGAQRSIPLKTLLLAFAKLPIQVNLVSLQYGQISDEIEAAIAESGVHLSYFPEVMVDQDEAAALTVATDMVVSVCQTQAHLSGALAKRGCVLVPSNPSWRYGLTGDGMPWYPALVLLRQQRLGEWQPVLDQLSSVLSQGLSRPA